LDKAFVTVEICDTCSSPFLSQLMPYPTLGISASRSPSEIVEKPRLVLLTLLYSVYEYCLQYVAVARVTTVTPKGEGSCEGLMDRESLELSHPR
jgi:hypothetical protein